MTRAALEAELSRREAAARVRREAAWRGLGECASRGARSALRHHPVLTLGGAALASALVLATARRLPGKPARVLLTGLKLGIGPLGRLAFRGLAG